MALKSTVVALAVKALDVLRREPVAVWGVVLAAVVCALPALGVSAAVVEAVSAIISLLGIPVVRGKVTPLAAVEALIKGALQEDDDAKAPAKK